MSVRTGKSGSDCADYIVLYERMLIFESVFCVVRVVVELYYEIVVYEMRPAAMARRYSGSQSARD